MIDPSDQSRNTGPIGPRMISSAARSPCSRLSGTPLAARSRQASTSAGMRRRSDPASALDNPPGRPRRSRSSSARSAGTEPGETIQRRASHARHPERVEVRREHALDLGKPGQRRRPDDRVVADRGQRRAFDVLGDDPPERAVGGDHRRDDARIDVGEQLGDRDLVRKDAPSVFWLKNSSSPRYVFFCVFNSLACSCKLSSGSPVSLWTRPTPLSHLSNCAPARRSREMFTR